MDARQHGLYRYRASLRFGTGRAGTGHCAKRSRGPLDPVLVPWLCARRFSCRSDRRPLHHRRKSKPVYFPGSRRCRCGAGLILLLRLDHHVVESSLRFSARQRWTCFAPKDCISRAEPEPDNGRRRVLRNHPLKQFAELKVGDDVFNTRYEKGCSMYNCRGRCCADGVDLDIVERAASSCTPISSNRTWMKPRTVTQNWFQKTRPDADFPSGECTTTALGENGCVFLNKGGYCVVHIAESHVPKGFGFLKPSSAAPFRSASLTARCASTTSSVLMSTSAAVP